MCRLRACAAIAVWISAMLAMSGCSLLQDLIPPPLATALSPAPLPPAPPGPPPAPPAPPAPQSQELPSPDQARAEIWQWLMAHGYQQFQVQALLWHAQVESGFQPCAASPGGFRYTFQWGSTRLEQLHRFAHTDGCPQLHVQLAFADWELRNDPKFSCFWGATSAPAALAALRRGFGRGSC
jgi:hypothetical protein